MKTESECIVRFARLLDLIKLALGLYMYTESEYHKAIFNKRLHRLQDKAREIEWVLKVSETGTVGKD